MSDLLPVQRCSLIGLSGAPALFNDQPLWRCFLRFPAIRRYRSVLSLGRSGMQLWCPAALPLGALQRAAALAFIFFPARLLVACDTLRDQPVCRSTRAFSPAIMLALALGPGAVVLSHGIQSLWRFTVLLPHDPIRVVQLHVRPVYSSQSTHVSRHSSRRLALNRSPSCLALGLSSA